MVDHITPERRSWLMSRVRGKHTSPEVRVRRVAHKLGFRFRLHRKELPGKPDLVFPKYRAVLFVHGCFWHRHAGCPKASIPKSRTDYWLEKFEMNIARDICSGERLTSMGWKVSTIWECETRNAEVLEAHLRTFLLG